MLQWFIIFARLKVHKGAAVLVNERKWSHETREMSQFIKLSEGSGKYAPCAAPGKWKWQAQMNGWDKNATNYRQQRKRTMLPPLLSFRFHSSLVSQTDCSSAWNIIQLVSALAMTMTTVARVCWRIKTLKILFHADFHFLTYFLLDPLIKKFWTSMDDVVLWLFNAGRVSSSLLNYYWKDGKIPF